MNELPQKKGKKGNINGPAPVNNNGTKNTKKPQHVGPPNLTVLKENEIYPLVEGKGAKSGNNNENIDVNSQRFRCHACNCRLDSGSSAMQHIYVDGHRRSLKELQSRIRLLYMPPPTEVHLQALNNLLTKEVKKAQLSLKESMRRKAVATKVIDIITQACPDVEVHLFGSLTTNLSIAESDVNLTMWTKDMNPLQGKLIKRVCDLLNSNKQMAREKRGVTSPPSTPVKVEPVDEDNRKEEVEEEGEESSEAPELDETFLYDFTISYSHAAPAGVILRDSQQVLYKITVMDQSNIESDKLIAKYCEVDKRCHDLAILFRKFARVADIDKPEKGALVSRIFPVMSIFYLQNMPAPVVLPNLQHIAERNSSHIPPQALHVIRSHDVDVTYLSDLSYLPKFFDTTANHKSLAELWLGLLRFYVVDFNKEEYVASITDFHPIVKLSTSNSSKKLAVQDPINTKLNLCHTVSPSDTHYFIQSQLSDALIYFSVPQLALRDKTNKRGAPLFVNLKLDMRAGPQPEKKKDGKDTELIGLTMSYIRERTYSKPMRKVQKVAFDHAHTSTVAEDNSYVSLDAIRSVNNLCNWMLEYVCLMPLKTGFPISSWGLQLSLIEQKDDQVARWVRFATEFCRCAWDRCWEEYFNREQYTVTNANLMDLVKHCLQLSLKETVLSDNSHDCYLLTNGVEPTEVPDVEEEKPVGEVEEKPVEENHHPEECKPEDVEDEEEDGDEETVDEVLPSVPDVEDESVSPVKNPSTSTSVASEVAMYTKSGWEIAMKQIKLTERVLVDCHDAGFYNAELLKKVEKVSDLHFQFDVYMLCQQQGLIPLCSSCKNQGHLRDVCPQYMPHFSHESRPQLPVDEEKGQWLDDMLRHVARSVEPTPDAKEKRETTFKKIQSLVLERFPRAVLKQFGSSVNGFGCLNSDLDINLSFPEAEDANQLLNPHNINRLVNQTETLLRRSRQFGDIQGIRHAKVPIVKFKDVSTGIEGDISFSNRLAVENTRLLKTYAQLEPNCQTLGLALKHLVKVCNIGDASCGSLSSYAYIVLIIHYLQQKGHLPVLQQIYEGTEKPVRIFDDYDTWFQEDEEIIKKHWSSSTRPATLSELWLGFFDYFVYEFLHTEQVVTIRQKDVLLKLDKLWTNRDFAIEDPFELSHNLGSGLSRKMFCYILGVFHQVLLTHSQPTQLPTPDDIRKLYFNCESLTKGKATPKDRGCKICGKIGHIAKNCPQSPSTPGKNRRQNSQNQENESKQTYIACIPLVTEEDQKAGMGEKQRKRSNSGQSSNQQCRSVLHIGPRKDPTFLKTQPDGEMLGREGYVVEPIMLEVNGHLVLIPVLTHRNPEMIHKLAMRQKEFAHHVPVGTLSYLASLAKMNVAGCNGELSEGSYGRVHKNHGLSLAASTKVKPVAANPAPVAASSNQLLEITEVVRRLLKSNDPSTSGASTNRSQPQPQHNMNHHHNQQQQQPQQHQQTGNHSSKGPAVFHAPPQQYPLRGPPVVSNPRQFGVQTQQFHYIPENAHYYEPQMHYPQMHYQEQSRQHPNSSGYYCEGGMVFSPRNGKGRGLDGLRYAPPQNFPGAEFSRSQQFKRGGGRGQR